MSVHSSTGLSVPRKPFWRRQSFWRVTLPVLAGLALALAGVMVYNAFVGTSGLPNAKQGWGVTYATPATQKSVPLDPRVEQVVERFIHAAVGREDLRAAYALSGPQIRQGMSLRQFLAGNIAVVPFPVDSRTKASMKVAYSHPDRAQLAVYLATPGRNVTNSPHSFYVDLIKRNGTWLVNNWVPRWTPPIPTNPGR